MTKTITYCKLAVKVCDYTGQGCTCLNDSYCQYKTLDKARKGEMT